VLSLNSDNLEGLRFSKSKDDLTSARLALWLTLFGVRLVPSEHHLKRPLRIVAYLKVAVEYTSDFGGGVSEPFAHQGCSRVEVARLDVSSLLIVPSSLSCDLI